MIEYNICYSLDSKYIEQLAVSMCSVLKNSLTDEKIKFYILDGGLSSDEKSGIEQLKKIKDFFIEYIKINSEEFLNCPLNVIKNGDKMEPTHVTLPAYFRIKLPSLLKDFDKILYLDCDVIVRTSLKELFEQDVKDKAVLMTLDAESQKEAQRLSINRYFNSGILLINLDYWRKNDVENRLFNYIRDNQSKILWFDQDVINVVLENEIGEISNKWNYQYFQYEKIDINEFANSSIIHMAGRFKPWLMPFEHPVYDLYYYYLSFTLWRKNITLYQNMSAGKHLKDGIGGCVTNITVDATDEDIQKIYSELDNTYKYINVTKEVLETKIDSTELLNNELAYRLGITTDEKISKVYDEVSKNYKYTEKLVENVDSKLDTYKNVTDIKLKEISSSSNEEISKVYNATRENHQLMDNKFENKYFDSIKKIEDINVKLESFYQGLDSKMNVSEFKKIEEIIIQYNMENKQALEDLQKKFAEEINNQRIKYENKLMELEKIISSFDSKYQQKKSGILTRIKNKLKKRKNK